MGISVKLVQILFFFFLTTYYCITSSVFYPTFFLGSPLFLSCNLYLFPTLIPLLHPSASCFSTLTVLIYSRPGPQPATLKQSPE